MSEALRKALKVIDKHSVSAIRTNSKDRGDWAEDMAYVGKVAREALAQPPAPTAQPAPMSQPNPLVDKREGLGMQLLPMTNQCHKCKEWFHTVHVCADSVKVRQCCDHCDDGDGHSVFPYYGVAPHHHDPTGEWLGTTRLLPRHEWGPNFREDPDSSGQGTYMRCPQCGRGEPEAA